MLYYIELTLEYEKKVTSPPLLGRITYISLLQ